MELKRTEGRAWKKVVIFLDMPVPYIDVMQVHFGAFVDLVLRD